MPRGSLVRQLHRTCMREQYNNNNIISVNQNSATKEWERGGGKVLSSLIEKYSHSRWHVDEKNKYRFIIFLLVAIC